MRTIESAYDGSTLLALFDDSTDTRDFYSLGTIYACDRDGFRGDLLAPYGLSGRLLTLA